MRKTTLLALSGYVAFIALVFWACGGHNPASPSRGEAAFGPSPVPTPVQPGSGSGPGSSPTPVQPRPIGPSPSPTPVQGGGGGNPSPSPSPSGTPTPGPTPTPTPTPTPVAPCPAILTINAVGTPMLLSDAQFNDAVFPLVTANYDSHCVVKEVKISMHVTTVTGFVGGLGTDYTKPTVQLGVCGGGIGFNGCIASRMYSFQTPGQASGNQIGTTCSDFAFDTASATVWDPMAPPAAPFSGTYQLDPARSGVGDLWYLKGLQYTVAYSFGHPPDTILECARIDVTTQNVP